MVICIWVLKITEKAKNSENVFAYNVHIFIIVIFVLLLLVIIAWNAH